MPSPSSVEVPLILKMNKVGWQDHMNITGMHMGYKSLLHLVCVSNTATNIFNVKKDEEKADFASELIKKKIRNLSVIIGLSLCFILFVLLFLCNSHSFQLFLVFILTFGFIFIYPSAYSAFLHQFLFLFV